MPWATAVAVEVVRIAHIAGGNGHARLLRSTLDWVREGAVVAVVLGLMVHALRKKWKVLAAVMGATLAGHAMGLILGENPIPTFLILAAAVVVAVLGVRRGSFLFTFAGMYSFLSKFSAVATLAGMNRISAVIFGMDPADAFEMGKFLNVLILAAIVHVLNLLVRSDHPVDRLRGCLQRTRTRLRFCCPCHPPSAAHSVVIKSTRERAFSGETLAMVQTADAVVEVTDTCHLPA